MELEQWKPRVELTEREEKLMGRLRKSRRLFAFLRERRHELFDDAFQRELSSMYRETGAGSPPIAPAVLAMVVLLQAYMRTSDAEAVELTVVDLRWQLVLDRLGESDPLCSQGAIQDFRERMIAHEMDRRMLERTAEIARRTHAVDAKKVPKTVRVAMDSMPLEGAGRVEDTFNLIAHAARRVADCAAAILERSFDDVCRDARVPMLAASSAKKWLDIDWSNADAKADALQRLVAQVERLVQWVERRLGTEADAPPMSDRLETLQQVLSQDLEPDPDGGQRIREGVAPDRRVSIEDPEMRHGRKSKSKRFNGYKRHLAGDLDTGVILAVAVTPANRPEDEAAPTLRDDVARQRLTIAELHVDRGYINSCVVEEVREAGRVVICKPWMGRNSHVGMFGKRNFDVNVRRLTITCPAGETQPFQTGEVVEFEPEACDRCDLRERCTMASPGRGRTVRIAEDEALQHDLRKLQTTQSGRARLRQRVGIEHSLAHVAQRQGRRARYRGVRRNVFDLRRVAAVQNLENAQRRHQLNCEIANAA
jgi:IS5 family transposase